MGMNLPQQDFKQVSTEERQAKRGSDMGRSRSKAIKTLAATRLEQAIAQIPRIKLLDPTSVEFQKWASDTLTDIGYIFGNTSRHYEIFSAESRHFRDERSMPTLRRYFAERLDSWRDRLQAMLQEVEVKDHCGDSVALDHLILIRQMLARFHPVAQQLRRRHDHRETLSVEDHYDVRDLLHTLLRLHFDDIADEVADPKCTESPSRLPFALHAAGVVVVVKKTGPVFGTKEAEDQLRKDLEFYRKGFRRLICFIYDPDGYIRNPRAFMKGWSREGEYSVEVHISPVHA